MSIYSRIFSIGSFINDELRDRKYPTPSDIRVISDIVYHDDPTVSKLDIISPMGENLPVIVDVHGGGYVYGNRKIYRAYGMELAKRGFIVVNFDYHLAPKYTYPKPLEDINQVMVWVVNNIEKYSGDLNKIFVVGDSAGAQLASQYLTILTNSEYAKNFDFKVPKITVQGCALNCGMYDLSVEKKL